VTKGQRGREIWVLDFGFRMKKREDRLQKSGIRAFTLVEMLVVVVIVGLMMTIGMPALKGMFAGNRVSQARNLIRTMLSEAQSLAVTQQRYVGVRFQYDKDGWENGRQYAVLVEKVAAGASIGIYEYNAVVNLKPMALPLGVGVISMVAQNDIDLDDTLNSLAKNGDGGIRDFTTFTIVFSPAGQMVVKDVEVRSRLTFFDSTFNSEFEVNRGVALLYMDRWSFPTVNLDGAIWNWGELSTTGMYLFEVEVMQGVDVNNRWDGYVRELEAMLINIYTGAVIEE